ncbi:DUF488 domain-containing protein [Sphingobacterium sp. SYP-B4668]|uniref:DUF488 domain-containing protein n=1 Tax=Sphingobacterium sp. SYP-B4668 TaxID=2996035 RepID=UPI0022DE90A9|nr:DUF488 family protein [Sphingobacterium sp. SYP-B4668]
MQPQISIKRIYEKPDEEDGYRVLIDRLWPRGLAKENAKIDEWAKDIASSTEIRLAYAHVLERWEVFEAQYKKELTRNELLPTYLDKWEDQPTITLLYAAKDQQHSNAIVLKQYLEEYYKEQR